MDVTAPDVSLIAHKYLNRRINTITILSGGRSNEAWSVSTDNGRYVLRKHQHGAFHWQRAYLFGEFLRSCSATNPKIIHPIRLASGLSHLNSAGAWYSLWPYVDGIAGRQNAGLLDEVIVALQTLHGQDHSITSWYPPIVSTPDLLHQLRDFFSQDYSSSLRAYRPFIIDALNRAIIEASSIQVSNFRVVHGDAHPRNTISIDNVLAGLIDYDSMHVTEPDYDFAVTIESFARIESGTGTAYDEQLMCDVIDRFSSAEQNSNAGSFASTFPAFVYRKLANVLRFVCQNGLSNSEDVTRCVNRLLAFRDFHIRFLKIR